MPIEPGTSASRSALLLLGFSALFALAGCGSTSNACSASAQCGSGAICRAGVCVPGCANNNDCPSGETCNGAGTCVAPAGCTRNQDCPSGHLCDGTGACVVPPTLAITPTAISLSPQQTVLFHASGGSGSYTWSLASGATGTIDASTGFYSAGATGAGDTVKVADTIGGTASAQVTLVPLPLIGSFSALEPFVTAGADARLTAVFSGGTGTIDKSVGTVVSGVTVNVALTQSTTFTLTVTNSVGVQTTSQVTVQTVAAPQIASFTATPTSVIGSDPAREIHLHATYSNGSGVVSPGALSLPSGTTLTVSPQDTTAYVLTVSNTATTPGTATQTAIVQVARTLSVNRGDGQGGVVALPLPVPLEAFVADNADAGVPGIPVHWSYPGYYYIGYPAYQLADGGTDYDTSTVTDEHGVASVTAVLGTRAGASIYSYPATIDNLQEPVSIAFTESASPGPADHLAAQAPQQQNATAGRAVGSIPAVMVEDQYSNGIPDAGVSFEVLDGGGYLVLDQANAPVLSQSKASDPNGSASADGWTVGTSPTEEQLNVLRASLVGRPEIYLDFTANSEVLPQGALAASPSTVVLGNQILLSGTYLNSSDGTQVIDHGVGQVQVTPFSQVATRASYLSALYNNYFDVSQQLAESVVFTLTVQNGAALPGVTQATATVQVLDAEWPLWTMPDSATASCVDPELHTSIACNQGAAAGEDGNLSNDMPTYSSDPSGGLKDSVTGLVWQSDTGSQATWQGAGEACHLLGDGWRLPTAVELVTLVDYGAAPAYTAGTSFSWPGNLDLVFWTATPDAYNAGEAWTINFASGSVVTSGQTESHYVRCVR